MTTMTAANARWSFWIDRGGTFTDVIGRAPGGGLVSLKLPSQSPAYADAAVEAMRRLLDVSPFATFPADRIASIKVGTTVATNALLERKGARTVFVATAGFADALAIGDQSRPDLFALDIDRATQLYESVIEADERLAADGAVVRPLDETDLTASLAAAVAAGFDSVAIAFLHSDLNPAHEQSAAALARAAGFSTVVVSSEVSPLPRLLPRAETAVADAYLTPPLRDYADRLSRAVRGADLRFMTSGGGLTRSAAFHGRDAVLSGPAGGAVGVAQTARAVGAPAVLGFDMGGTSTDVCRWAGVLERRDTTRVAGVTLRAPMLDVETVASGGGSVLAFDGLRARVGPHSAGAMPGPAAYGRGGPATVTDANLVLGHLAPTYFPHVFGPYGDSPLDPVAARDRLSSLAAAMGLPDAEAAASGFIAIAVEQMAGAIARVSTERGFDPRDHALVAFGGAAGQVACQVADNLGINEVLCPKYGSLLSAWGIGQASLRAAREAGLEAPLDDAGLAAALSLCRDLTARVRDDLRAQGAEASTTTCELKIRYAESDTALPTPLGALEDIAAAFAAAHQRLFGFVEDGGAVIASVAVEAIAPESSTLEPGSPSEAPRPEGKERRLSSVTGGAADRRGGGRGGVASPYDPVFVDRISGPIDGPRLILRGDTQIWLAPGWRATPDADGLVRLRRITPQVARPSAHDAADPVTLELFNRRFMGVAEAMGAALERTARSVNIKERLDFSCALFDADGGLVANAPHMPVHLGSMGASVRAVQARHPVLNPGEAFALNNPYAGGTHLPDITVVMPVFAETASAPLFFVAARGHHADVGGIAPGSMPPFSRTIDEEGVMLDALPILKGGRFLDADVRAALGAGRWPARAPDRNIGDLKAQIAACRAGAAAVLGMIEAHGSDQVSRYMAFVQANAEACVRRAVGALTDGEARVPMDGGGEIAVAVTVDRTLGEATLDFTASSAQLPTNFNAPSSIVDAAALYVFRTLVDDDIPLNAGCLTPLRVKVSPGSMLSPVAPGAVVAGNVETSQHIVDALYSAVGVMANSQGSMNNFTFGDATRQYYETICGGVGATARAGGASAVHSHMTNSRLTDPEILERRFPVRLESFAIRRGSGGSGLHWGGDGVIRRLRFLAPMTAALLSTRRDHAPQGLAGGGPGEPGAQHIVRVDGTVEALPGCFSVEVQPGDIIEIETPGGGGYGRQ